jgi:hypothetical protein
MVPLEAVMASCAVLMTSDSEAEEALWGVESVTVKTSPDAVPVAVGVPEMTPVVAFRESPKGRVPDVRAQWV